MSEQAAVGFQLGFTWATQANGTAALALKMRPATNQPRGHVLQLRQLHLQLALVALCTLRKDVEDQPRAIDHAAAQQLFQVAFLDRRQLMVDQHQIGIQRRTQVTRLLGLATTYQQRRIGLADARAQRVQHLGTRRPRQLHELGKNLRIIVTRCIGLYQQGAITAPRSFEHQSSA